MMPRKGKVLWLVVRVVVSAACVAWVLANVPWTDQLDSATGQVVAPGFLNAMADVFASSAWLWLPVGVAAYTLSPLCGAVRWRMLLAVQGVRLSLAEAWRLTYIGFFFNTFLPGVTGGDLVKAWYAARQTESKKAEAIATVFLDRLIGLFGMALLCVAAITVRWNDPNLATVRSIVLTFVAVAAAAAVLLLSRHARQWFRVRSLWQRLPVGGQLLSRLDAAVALYRHRGRLLLVSILISWGAHLVSITAVYCSALALGLTPSPWDFVIYMPVIWIAASVMPTVGGLGPMEYLATLYFTADVLGVAGNEAARAQALATILLFRVVMFVAVAPGGLLHALPGSISVRQARQDLEEASHLHG
jgi:uncharacterized protein (TIRG00374 family)